MTLIGQEMKKCIKCGKESQQMVVYSVNFLVGTEEENRNLLSRKQVCPHCNYTAFDISKKKTL